MPDQPSGFTVTDRRKFTIEGDLREGASAAEEASAPVAKPQPEPETKSEAKLGPKLVQNEPAVEKEVVNRNLEPLPPDESQLEESEDDEALLPEPTAAESAQQDADYRASSKKLDDMISQANPGARDTLGGRYLRSFWQPVFHSADIEPGRAMPLRSSPTAITTMCRGCCPTPEPHHSCSNQAGRSVRPLD